MAARMRRLALTIGAACSFALFSGAVSGSSASAKPRSERVSVPTSHSTSLPQSDLPGWMPDKLAPAASLDAIACPTEQDCFAVGAAGGGSALIEESSNAGATWTAQTLAGGRLDAVSCPDATHCLATGSAGTAFSTSDGADWNQLNLPAGTPELTAVSCISDSACWASSDQGQGVMTSDGGQSWSAMPYGQSSGTTPLKATGVAFTSTSQGWVVGENSSCTAYTACIGSVQVTTSAGQSWSPSSTPSTTPGLEAIACPNSVDCVAVGGSSLHAGGVRTTNGGASWSTISLPSNMSEAYAVTCPDSAHCYAVGSANAVYYGFGVLASSDAMVASTSNGGQTWIAQPIGGGLQSLVGVSCSDDLHCQAAGATYGGPAEVGTANGGAAAAPGYWLVASDGGIFAYNAPFYGSTGAIHLAEPVVGMAADPLTGGYWLVASDGGIFAYNAPFYGSTGGTHLKKNIVAMAADPVTGGYWLVASDGGIFAYNAPFFGSTAGSTLPAAIVGMAALPDGTGYFLIGLDGSVYAFGAATHSLCSGRPTFAKATVGIAVDPETGGYWMVSAGGGIGYCSAPDEGNTAQVLLARPIEGIAADPAGGGYWMVASDGGIFAFNAPFLGSTGNVKLHKPVVGMAAVPGL